MAASSREPHDVPTAGELVEAVREWLESDVLPNAEGQPRFHARVAVNVLGMVERELALGAGHAAAHRARLDRLGVTDDRELAARIRARDLPGVDAGADTADDVVDAVELRALLLEAVVDKLAVANPRYLDATHPDPA